MFSVICVPAASAAITRRLNPFAVISSVRNINVQSLGPAPGLHTIMLRPTFVTRSRPGLTNTWLRVFKDYFIRTESRAILKPVRY